MPKDQNGREIEIVASSQDEEIPSSNQQNNENELAHLKSKFIENNQFISTTTPLRTQNENLQIRKKQRMNESHAPEFNQDNTLELFLGRMQLRRYEGPQGAFWLLEELFRHKHELTAITLSPLAQTLLFSSDKLRSGNNVVLVGKLQDILKRFIDAKLNFFTHDLILQAFKTNQSFLDFNAFKTQMQLARYSTGSVNYLAAVDLLSTVKPITDYIDNATLATLYLELSEKVTTNLLSLATLQSIVTPLIEAQAPEFSSPVLKETYYHNNYVIQKNDPDAVAALSSCIECTLEQLVSQEGAAQQETAQRTHQYFKLLKKHFECLDSSEQYINQEFLHTLSQQFSYALEQIPEENRTLDDWRLIDSTTFTPEIWEHFYEASWNEIEQQSGSSVEKMQALLQFMMQDQVTQPRDIVAHRIITLTEELCNLYVNMPDLADIKVLHINQLIGDLNTFAKIPDTGFSKDIGRTIKTTTSSFKTLLELCKMKTPSHSPTTSSASTHRETGSNTHHESGSNTPRSTNSALVL